jgi:beta-glucosidase
MAVTLRFRVDQPSSGPVKMSLACGPSCGAAIDVTALVSGGAPGGWRTMKIKLSCFRTLGANMATVSSPFALSTSGRLSLTFTDIRLATNEGDAVCPGG